MKLNSLGLGLKSENTVKLVAHLGKKFLSQ